MPSLQQKFRNPLLHLLVLSCSLSTLAQICLWGTPISSSSLALHRWMSRLPKHLFCQQLRKRNCVADEPAAVCESLHESVKTQFRLCKDLSLCQEDDENLCHQDWYRIKPSGPYLYGCNDIFNNGTFACPSPGGVDVDSVLNPNEVYLCKSKKIRKNRS